MAGWGYRVGCVPVHHVNVVCIRSVGEMVGETTDPWLEDLQRVLDEIMLSVAPASHEVTQGRLILEQVPEIRNALLRKSDAEWKDIAKKQLSTYFADSPEARRAAAERMEGMSKMFEFMCELDENKRAAEAVKKPDPPPPDGVVRVDFSRQAEDGQWYRWHCYDMHIDAAKGAKQVELSLEDGYTMHGDQHKLLPPAGPHGFSLPHALIRSFAHSLIRSLAHLHLFFFVFIAALKIWRRAYMSCTVIIHVDGGWCTRCRRRW